MAIGDTVTDAFIRLKEASVHCTLDREKCEICMRFADKIPYEDVFVIPAVGNSANAAVSTARLGLRSALVTNIGDDYHGKEALAALGKEHVGTEYVAINPGQKTNYHYVLWYEDDRTILVKHEAYDYSLPDIDDPAWLYLSSLGNNSLGFHHQIEKYLHDHPRVKLAFQPGTFQIKFGKDELAGIYRRAEVFFCNKEEAERILEIEKHDIKKLLQMTHELGPKIVVITDGPSGAYAYDGHDMWSIGAYPDPKPPYERTGAGDAFSSTFTAALALGKSVPEALSWAPINSMSVVQEVGARAGLLSREKLEEYLAKAPADYKPKII
ncbi:MAG: carbohydrate kinase family protein [Candidatus Sungbacteria bacterium]|nr:carbohydrate kinase family protein [Candidatus Sungbacteria bacterium]